MSVERASGYADLRMIRRRLNLDDTQTAADQKIKDAMRTADNHVNTQVGLHATVPIPNPDDELKTLASDLAGAHYNYWTSTDKKTDGIAKFEKAVQEHIMARYGQKNPSGVSGNTFSKASGNVTGLES